MRDQSRLIRCRRSRAGDCHWERAARWQRAREELSCSCVGLAGNDAEIKRSEKDLMVSRTSLAFLARQRLWRIRRGDFLNRYTDEFGVAGCQRDIAEGNDSD
jgi:hypothetical protein